MASRVVLVRHGETEWSKTGQHTGRTDIGLTAQGQDEARLVVPTLSAWTFTHSFSSPLVRALETARLAGFEPEIDDGLMEWDYGEIEGRRNDEITAEQPGWSKWHSEVRGGEQVDQVGERADAFLARTAKLPGEIVVFAHGHFLSIMIARWLGLPADQGRRFPLATATVSVLGSKRDDNTLETMNHRCGSQLSQKDVVD